MKGRMENLVLPLIVAVGLSDFLIAVEALSCNVCDYTKSNSCASPAEYRPTNCDVYWPDARFCFKMNGTLRAVRKDGGAMDSSGIHRMCQKEHDVDDFGLPPGMTDGCRNLHVFNSNTSLYRSFSFDGVLCLCDGSNCNSGPKVSSSFWLLTFSAALLLPLIIQSIP